MLIAELKTNCLSVLCLPPFIVKLRFNKMGRQQGTGILMSSFFGRKNEMCQKAFSFQNTNFLDFLKQVEIESLKKI